MSFNFYTYIITNKNNTTFYVGVTNDLVKRMHEHINELNESFSKKYKLKKLIYYEWFTNINDAIRREKQLKNWHRDWKISLIKKINPDFKDLYQEWRDAETSSA